MVLPSIQIGDFFEVRTLYGRDIDDWTPYMSRVIIGRLRLHVFHRGDDDPDPHDHPWDFWTFPLTSYAEEVTERDPWHSRRWRNHVQIVRAFHWHHRPAEHTHRVLHRVRRKTWLETTERSFEDGLDNLPSDPEAWVKRPGPITTLVWTGAKSRKWGFLKTRDGKWCWVAWREYIHGGGKHGPCE